MIKFFTEIWNSIFCTHEKTDEIIFYCVESIPTPAITVYHRETCKKCGREFTSKISEYPIYYYNLHNVIKKLETKGIQSMENILQERIKLKRS